VTPLDTVASGRLQGRASYQETDVHTYPTCDRPIIPPRQLVVVIAPSTPRFRTRRPPSRCLCCQPPNSFGR